MPKRKCSNIDVSVGERLKNYRIKCGLTQQQVANMLNINRSTYTKYETGVSEPSQDLLAKIVKIYGIDFNSVLGGNEFFDRKLNDDGYPMNNLTPSEKELIAGYRTLPKDEQKKISENVQEIVIERRKKFL